MSRLRSLRARRLVATSLAAMLADPLMGDRAAEPDTGPDTAVDAG